MRHSGGTLEVINPGGKNSDNRDPVCEVLVGTWTLSSARLEANHMIFGPKTN